MNFNNNVNINHMNKNTTQTKPINTQEKKEKTGQISIKLSIKTVIIVVAIIAAIVLAYVYKGLFIAATVNGSPISRLTVIQKLEKASGKNLLDSLIVQKLVQDEANAKKISISNDEIDNEIKKIEDQITAQGSTLDAALTTQGMNMEDLKKQIIFQKEVEKLVANKINVTDEEVVKYIKDNAVPNGEDGTITAQIKDGLRGQKLNTESNSLITALRSQAKIRYFINY